MNEHIQSRIERLSKALIQHKLDLLILLMAQHGATKQVQTSSIDVLVRSLLSCQIKPTLFESGRRIPIVVDHTTQIPIIKFNAELLSRLSDDEILFTFTRPIAQILKLPTLNIGLILQGTDEKQLRNLYYGAARRMKQPLIKSTDVQAVVELRVRTFATRLRDLVLTLSKSRIKLTNPRSFIAALTECPTWPDWDDIAHKDFLAHALQTAKKALAGNAQVPPAKILLELCWDSLNLSPQSFLRQAGRTLRSGGVQVHEQLLMAMARVVAPYDFADLAHIATWPDFYGIDVSWQKLRVLEFEQLGPLQLGANTISEISVLRPPSESFGLREPEDLPWSFPLICWSVRETSALGDLLSGFIQSYPSQNDSKERHTEHIGQMGHVWHLGSLDEPAMNVHKNVDTINMAVSTHLEPPPDHYDVLVDRAYAAALTHMISQFDDLPPTQQIHTLHMLRSAYDSLFKGTTMVWERRLQGWQLESKHAALIRLATAVRAVFDCPVFLDPFTAPDGAQLQTQPGFCFIVALTSMWEHVPFFIPITTLMMTASADHEDLRVRAVEMSHDPSQRAIWCGDRMLNMSTLHSYPVDQTLCAVHDNTLCMIASVYDRL